MLHQYYTIQLYLNYLREPTFWHKSSVKYIVSSTQHQNQHGADWVRKCRLWRLYYDDDDRMKTRVDLQSEMKIKKKNNRKKTNQSLRFQVWNGPKKRKTHNAWAGAKPENSRETSCAWFRFIDPMFQQKHSQEAASGSYQLIGCCAVELKQAQFADGHIISQCPQLHADGKHVMS